MKHIKYILLMFIFLIFPLNAYAKCSDEEKNLYNLNKDKFKVEKTFNKDTLTYNVKFYNPMPDNFKYEFDPLLNRDNYVFIDEHNEKFNNISNETENYLVYITGNTSSCDEPVDWIIISTSVNKYYFDPMCEGIEEFVLCSPNYEKEIDYDTFFSRTNTYRKTKIEEQNKIEEEPKEDKLKLFFENTLEFIEDNLGLIILALAAIIILIILIIMIIKSYKRRWKLE